MDSGDWRTQLPLPDSRQRIVNKIMKTLSRHLAVPGQEVLELQKVAVQLEEEIYAVATSQEDYLRKLSLKVLTMDTTQNPITSSLHPNAASSGPDAHGPASLDSTAQMGNANAADWQEETYQKINSMKEMYLSEVNDLYQRIASKVQEHDSLPHRPQNEQIEKLKMFKMALERIVLYLQLNKHDIQLSHKEKLLAVEKHISFFLSANRGKPASSPLPGQLPESFMQQLIAHQTNVANLQRNQLMHQQTNQLEMEMQQRLQTSAPLFQQQNVMEQQKQLYQPQRAAQEASSSYENTNCDSTAQMGNANAADWQEEVYQKIKSMKEMFLSELSDLYQKTVSKVQQHDSLPHHPQNEQIEKLKMFKMTLERIVLYLQLNKHEIQLSHKEKLLSVEKHISFFLSANRPRKLASSPVQGQLPQSSMHTSQAQNTCAPDT
ncbi:mediator of RNA polymerase II transcription subunit 15a-like isoform X2 [Lycium barbarum]|uniref:mediator of RNA polymerase II transcription subunit 15a-like isoform X2 n=1 Tax=Lycium barbarum TaxID=112863 RepID=UPI00293E3D43|nr:mediator of RNA polymerase II transcription subunit 15a-like isoform X2 [Lycium barbarum]